MLQLRTAVQLASLRQPFKKALLTAAHLGVDAVEIDARRELRPAELSQTAVRHIRKLLEDANLRVAAVAFPTRRGYEVPEDLQPRIEGTRAAMRLAYQLGARLVVNHLGHIPDDPNTRETLIQSLTELARFGDREGSHLAVIPGAVEPSDVRQLVEDLPESTLQLTLDPGELAAHGIAAEAMAAEAGCPIRYVYATDGVIDPTRREGMEVPLGRGVVDFPALLGKLEEQGYDGYLCVRRAQSPHAMEEIQNALEYLHALF